MRLDSVFLDRLAEVDPSLAERLITARQNPEAIEKKQHSELILEVSPHLEDFVGELFHISAELRALQKRHFALAPLFSVKRRFVFKKAASGMTPEKAEAIDGPALAVELETLFGEPLTESSYVDHVSRWLDDEKPHARTIAGCGTIRRVGCPLSMRGGRSTTTMSCSNSPASLTLSI